MIPSWPVVQVEQERRRLEVLRYLAMVNGYEAAAMLLRNQCRALGVPTTDDQMAGCIAWLDEQDLITVRISTNDEPIARITPRGRETALGQAWVPGVMKPEP